METGVTVYPTPAVCPTPEPSSVDPDDRTPDGRYFLEKCKKCGQVYKIPAFCTFTSTEEERKHFHTTPEEEAQMVKLLDKWEKDPASLEKDLGLRHTTKEKP